MWLFLALQTITETMTSLNLDVESWSFPVKERQINQRRTISMGTNDEMMNYLVDLENQ